MLQYRPLKSSILEIPLNPRSAPTISNAHFSYLLTILDMLNSYFYQILKR
nr:MAG TPA: hypothetical protein [Caudoviricetes sp.]